MAISAKEAGKRGGSKNTPAQQAARSRNGKLYGFQSEKPRDENPAQFDNNKCGTFARDIFADISEK